MNKYDFSRLPDVVWVNILVRLPLEDRYHLALTCSRMNDIFNHPSIWQTIDMFLIGNFPEIPRERMGSWPYRLTSGRRTKTFMIVVPERYLAMINRFGACFQDLRLTIFGNVFKLSDSCKAVLLKLAECRLRSLVLRIGEGVLPSNELPAEVCKVLTAVLKGAGWRLTNLEIKLWPLYSENEVEPMNSICRNEKLQNIKSLNLFWQNAAECDWIPLVKRLPAPQTTAAAIGCFPALTSLCLRSPMLTEDVLCALSKGGRATLARLGILVTYVGGNSQQHIRNSVWKHLCNTNVGLRVDFTFANTVPRHTLISLLSREIPVSSVSFMKFSRYDEDVLTHLADSYHETLTCFADYGENVRENELVTMATRCTSLRSLIYHGNLSCSTIETLAQLRGNHWKCFEVAVNRFDSPNDDDDLVLVPAAVGYAVAAHLPGSQFYHTDESEAQQLSAIRALSENVSSILGCKWTPLNE